MRARQLIGFLLLVVLLCVSVRDATEAQTRWPPWQSYGEAEKSARSKPKRRATPKQSEIDALNGKVAQLRQTGKIGEAIPLAERALGLTERRHGPNDAKTAVALTTLAELYVGKKRYANAEPLLKRALAIREKANPDGPEVSDALHALADLYKRQGRIAEAEPLLRRSAAMSDRVGTGRKATGGARAPATVEDEADAKGKTAGDKDEKSDRGSGAAPEAKARAQAEAEAKRLAEDEARRKAVAQAKRLAEQAEAMRKAAEAETLAAEERPKARAYRRAPPPAAASRNGGESAAAPENAPMAPRSMEPSAGAPAPAGVPEPPMPTMASPPPPPAGMTAPDATVAGPPTSWDVVPVFYGTDRAEEPNPRRVAYNSDRGRRLELGRALVTVPKLHEVPQIERPWAIRIPYFNVTIYEEAEDPNKHFTMQEIKKLPKEELLRLVRQRLAGSARFKDQALVFVHGYNTAFDNAVYRTAQIAYDLKFDGAPFVYSWPSGGAVASYTYDRESAGASKPYMRAFLDMVVKETGAKAVSIIAHSMGNQPLLDVLKDMKSSTPEGVVINQVVFAAPDVDSDSFANLAQAIKGLAKGVTLYAASNDRALIVSRNFWGYYRAGDVPPGGPLVLPGVDTIDVTAASTDAFAINHSGYAQNNSLLKDIGELIETGLRPPDQRLLKPRPVATEKGAYWRYVAPPAP